MPHFAKRHYEVLARIMQENCPCLPQIDGEYDDTGYDHDALGRQLLWDDLRDALATELMLDNPRFNRSRFIEACNKSLD